MEPFASILSAQHIRIGLASLSSQTPFQKLDGFPLECAVEGDQHKFGEFKTCPVLALNSVITDLQRSHGSSYLKPALCLPAVLRRRIWYNAVCL